MSKLKTAISLVAVVSAPLAAEAQKTSPAPAAQPRAVEVKADTARGDGAKAKPAPQGRHATVRPKKRAALDRKADVARGTKAKDTRRALIGEDGTRAIEAKADPYRGGGAKVSPADKVLPKPGR
ncbi:MAG: hypothetical protein KC613_23370 [Myxococcales bacterium]|nr:hypothetical protein [Myxococcales bacterium]